MTRLTKRKKRILWGGGLFVLTALVLAAALLPKANAGLRPPAQALVNASQGLDEIQVEARFYPESRSLTVSQTLRLTSRVQDSRDSVVLRAWPNAYQSVDTSPLATEEAYERCYPDGFSSGSLVMEEAAVTMGAGETPVFYRYTDTAKTVLALPLPSEWKPGESLEIHLRYTLTLPNARSSFGARENVFAFGNALLLPALWEEGAYRQDPFEPVGDPFGTDAANFSVSLSVPTGYTCAASASPADAREENGTVTYEFSALAARDFSFVISDDFHLAQTMEGNVLVSAYGSSAANAKKALSYLRNCLRFYGETYGEYPYQSLSLAEVELPYGGMEFSGLVMADASLFQQDSGNERLEYLIAHETAHQWWYVVAGSDQYNNAWQDEALCEFSVLEYMEAVHGKLARDRLYELNAAPSLRITLPATSGAPLPYFSSMAQYQTLVYNRGAAMLCALDEAMGGTFNGFLRAYYARFAFGRASRQDFFDLLANYTGEDYAPLMIDYLDTYIAP